jgi:Protein of unknown function (DUF1538)
MSHILIDLFYVILDTVWDVLPIVSIIFGFQIVILRKPILNLKKIITGFLLVILGLGFFLEGLQAALFPLGKLMAHQLTDPSFIAGEQIGRALQWSDYYWVYLFALAIGFSTAIAEPSVLAVAIKANQVSSGAIGIWGLRIAVAIGAAIGVALGVFRIISGTPLYWYIISGYVLVLIQTMFAPRMIIALAYDSGGVTTSTVTVPLVAALGLGLASTVPGRNPLLDGFGLIAITCLVPIMSVLAYAQLSAWRNRRSQNSSTQ